MNQIKVEFPPDWRDYQLLDSGEGEKLESFAGYKIVRPDPRIIWIKNQPIFQWQQADAVFDRNSKEGKWRYHNQPPSSWILKYQKYQFLLEPTDFRHVGIFPEQAVNWDWLEHKINGQKLKMLNLFAYTGAATVVSALSGATVTHVDSSKSAISWANKNTQLNNVPPNNLRWILEDAYKFAGKEFKRGNFYDGIIADPPRFGHGVKGEIWKLHDDLKDLVISCYKLLSPEAKFFLLNIYTSDLSAIAVYQLVKNIFQKSGGEIQVSEMAIKENNSDRLLPSGIVVRWHR